MSFRAMEFRFLVDFSFVSRYCQVFWSKQLVSGSIVSCALEKNLARKPHYNRRDFFICFVFPCSVFITYLGGSEEFSRLKSHVKFSSNKVGVVCYLYSSCKILKAGSEIALSWSPMRLKILHWRPDFHNWSPAGDTLFQATIIIQTTTVIFSQSDSNKIQSRQPIWSLTAFEG